MSERSTPNERLAMTNHDPEFDRLMCRVFYS